MTRLRAIFFVLSSQSPGRRTKRARMHTRVTEVEFVGGLELKAHQTETLKAASAFLIFDFKRSSRCHERLRERGTFSNRTNMSSGP